MKKRNTSRDKSERIRRERDPVPWRYCFLTLVCGLILVVGFFWAASQHFSAMDYGIKNARLRQQRENLEAEQRRLYLTREISLSPAEIKRAAKKIGLHDVTVKSIELISHKTPPANQASPIASIVKSEEAAVKTPFEKQVGEEKKPKEKEARENKAKPQTATKPGERPTVAKK